MYRPRNLHDNDTDAIVQQLEDPVPDFPAFNAPRRRLHNLVSRPFPFNFTSRDYKLAFVFYSNGEELDYFDSSVLSTSFPENLEIQKCTDSAFQSFGENIFCVDFPKDYTFESYIDF